MEESILKKVKYLMQSGPTDEKKSFNMLLESLALDSKDIDRLAKPVEDRIAKERHQAYATGCICVLVALAIVLLGALAMMSGIPVQDDAQLGSLWLAGAVLGGLLLLGMWAICEHYKDAGLVSDKRLLLYLRFTQEGSMGGMLEELEPKSGVVIHGHEEAAEEKPYRFLSPWAAKVAVLLVVLINVAIGAATIRSMMAFYEPNQTGVTLTSWSSGFGSSETVVIPSEQNGQPVTVIGKLAFENRRDVNKIVVPDTVTEIESGAFRGCTNLQEIVLPDTLTILGAEVFSGCRSLRSFTLPAGVTELRAETFLNCISLTDVKLHDGLTKLHASAFSNCSSLAEIKLPEGLEELPARLFYQCGALKSIVIPASVKEIGAYAFESCKQLTDVTFLSDMEGGKISAAAFRWCTSLKTFQVPKGVTDISSEAFYGCSALEEITMPVSLAEGKISASTFQNCISLRSIVIPEGVTSISAHAFRGCTSLSSVTVPASLRSIGSSAFRECRSLTAILLPSDCENESNSFKDSPTKITYAPAVDEYTVSNGQATLVKLGGSVSGVATVVVPAEYNGVPVTAIGDGAFAKRKDIKEVVLPDTIKTIGEEAFYECTSLASINLPDSLTTIKSWAFAYCSKLRSITIPAGVKVIDGMAFYEANLADGVVMPESMPGLYIGWAAFCGTKLKSIMLPEGLERITGFNDCDELIAVRIPNSVQSIAFNAFDGCRKLNTVQMPEVMSKGGITIEEHAFRNCTSLETITLPQGCKVDQKAFEGSGTEILYAGQTVSSAESVNAVPPARSEVTAGGYELRDGKAILISGRGAAGVDGVVEIPAEYNGYPVTEIGKGAFSGQTDITKVVLPDTITVIGGSAFKGCSLLREISLPTSLQVIEQFAFENCGQLERVALPDGLSKISTYAFYKCKRLSSVTFPASLQEIERKAFAECPLLTSVSVPVGCSTKAVFDKGVTIEFFTPAGQ